MPIGWKFTRATGRDWYTNSVNYRALLGKELVYPGECKRGGACGDTGFHLGKTIRGAGIYSSPRAIFKCWYSRRDVLGEDEDKVRVSRLRVLEKVPAWRAYGPRGRRLEDFIDSLGDIPWFAHVGKPIKKPAWVKRLVYVDDFGELPRKMPKMREPYCYSLYVMVPELVILLGGRPDGTWSGG